MVVDPLLSLLEEIQSLHWFEGDWLQRSAYTAIHSLQLLDLLAPFDPVLSGSFPLGIHTIHSDVDISCSTTNFRDLEYLLHTHFGNYPMFHIHHTTKHDIPTLIARWRWGIIPIEVFVQPIPTHWQRSVRHLLIEHLLLSWFPALRPAVRHLKHQGFATEPAFIRALGLKQISDPYTFLYELSLNSPAMIRQKLDGFLRYQS